MLFIGHINLLHTVDGGRVNILIYLAAVRQQQSTDALILLDALTLFIGQTDLVDGGRVNILIYLAAVRQRQSTDALRLLINLLQDGGDRDSFEVGNWRPI